MRNKNSDNEPDAVFFLKILIYFLIGTVWLRFTDAEGGLSTIALPFGLLLGVFFAHHEHLVIDRRLEFVILLASSVMAYFLPVGLVVLL